MLKTAFPMAKSWVKVTGGGKGWGMTTVNVRASLEEAAAFFWDFDSRAYAEITEDLERKVLRRRGVFQQDVRRRQKLENIRRGMNHEREFVNKMSLHVVGNDKIVIAMEPYEKNDHSKDNRLSKHLRNTFVRARERIVIRLEKKREIDTKIDFVLVSFLAPLGPLLASIWGCFGVQVEPSSVQDAS